MKTDSTDIPRINNAKDEDDETKTNLAIESHLEIG